jgi:serine-type D-Ala-D-Ala carboxypeptidase/endopeptidase (penicillin-binding protein 4)
MILMGCSPTNFIKKNIKESSEKLKHHTGFVLYDPIKKETLMSIHGDKYFTPASNTKIFTLYAGLKILSDSVPALRYINRSDSLIFWGTGDPSFLYGHVFQNQRTYDFLKNSGNKLIFSDGNFFEKEYGPGWSWDDYQDYYQVERSSFPIYGNVVKATRGNGISPSFFNSSAIGKMKTKFSGSSLFPNRSLRDRFNNLFFVNTDSIPSKLKIEIPFITSSRLTIDLLADTLNREVGLITERTSPLAKTLYSIPTDSLYKVMMKASDNFIAEQILLMCAQKISDSLKTDIAINYMMKNHLADLPDAPQWVDGSGLSRYNQMTPRSIVKLWEKIYSTVNRERLFPLLVANGQNGTLRNTLKQQPVFIYGKSGSLMNNYCLSGFLVTKKNRVLIFSSMNANVVESPKRVRENLEKILLFAYERY